jgi:hypothetical protein
MFYTPFCFPLIPFAPNSSRHDCQLLPAATSSSRPLSSASLKHAATGQQGAFPPLPLSSMLLPVTSEGISLLLSLLLPLSA